MRDLKRSNALLPAYKQLSQAGMEVFTPMVSRVFSRNGKRIRKEVPFMQDLLFVRESRERLDPIVERMPTLQYRDKIGVRHTPIVVRDSDMERFVNAVKSTDNPQYFRPDEVTPGMKNRKIIIIGGTLDGYTGTLVTTRGSKVKRLLVELPTLLAAAVEVQPEFIQLIK